MSASSGAGPEGVSASRTEGPSSSLLDGLGVRLGQIVSFAPWVVTRCREGLWGGGLQSRAESPLRGSDSVKPSRASRGWNIIGDFWSALAKATCHLPPPP